VPDIVSRSEAAALGLPRYFTGKPCKRGHVTERRTDNADCFDCIAMFKGRQPSGTAEQNRQRNDRLAQARLETHDDAMSARRRSLAGLGHMMQSSEAVARSQYLNAMIKASANRCDKDQP
jgi:transposase